MPRHTSDYRTIFWAWVLFPLTPTLAYIWPAALPWLLPLALYCSYCSGVLTHNHTHVPVFKHRSANLIHSMWLSIFYGCPIAVWIPTHLENHHRYLDGPEDVTRTTRRSPDHDLWQAFVYTVSSAAWHKPLIADYVRRAYARRGRHWAMLTTQSAALVLAHGGMLALALALHGTATGLTTYLFAFGLPALVAPSFMLFTNYIQHVHCDPASKDNHSRNFVSRLANWFVFENGYHTVHHERPSVHWSHYPELHRARERFIHPSLNESSVLSFCLKHYVLGALSPRFRSQPLASRLV